MSVVSQGPAAARVDLRHLDPAAYNASFRYRWEGAFDLGVVRTSCGSANVYNRTTGPAGQPGGYDADCMLACTHDYPRCRHYTYYPQDGPGGTAAALSRCELAGEACTYEAAPLAEATYATPGNNVLASALVCARIHTRDRVCTCVRGCARVRYTERRWSCGRLADSLAAVAVAWVVLLLTLVMG